MRTARFVATLFVSATLLFACQPLVARMIVPLLGGVPSVWIVCSLCFQALLLAGYGYAHVVGSRLSLRVQVALQVALVLAAFLALPIAVHEETARWAEAHPTAGLILLLLQGVGLPFFVLSTTSPLVQRWFAEMGENDPYYLYVASNAGSMLTLLGYPFALEPHLAVRAQSRALHAAYVAYALLVLLCGVTAIRHRAKLRVEATPAPPGVSLEPRSDPPPPSREPPARARWVERATWVGLAFAPSSLLLGATEYITTDLASVPLLWVVPLALYLGSFIVAFSKRPLVAPRIWSRVLAPLAACVAATVLAELLRPAWLVVAAHLLLLFVGSVVCHQALAARRPPVARLTEFYLLMSVGGVLGGVWNGLVAPVVFDDLVEYPLAIGLVCATRLFFEPEARASARPTLRRDALWGLALAAVTFALVKVGASTAANPEVAFVWMFGPALLVALAWSKYPLRHAVALGGILLAGLAHGGTTGQVQWSDRNFFGTLKVSRAPSGRYLMLVYGKAMHGQQALDPAEKGTPLAYYHPTGPAADVLGARAGGGGRRVGVIGLGVGSLAAYARPADHWTFFEINPAVVEVARGQFSFLASMPAEAKLDVEVGDARVRLKRGPAARFDVLVLDAISSDAIPVHLVTREALEVYRRALAPGGVLLAHVSNRHVELRPVFGALARDAKLVAIERADLDVTPELRQAGKSASEWVALTASEDQARRIAEAHGDWRPLGAPPSQATWTDDFANVLASLRF